MSIMSQKTRINLYLDSSVGESFKRFCRAHRRSYSEVLEPIIYRLLSTPTNHETSNLTVIQNEIHDQAVQAYRDVYDAGRQEVIETAITDSVDEAEDLSPTIPMPYPTTEVNHYGTRTRTRRLSKRSISR